MEGLDQVLFFGDGSVTCMTTIADPLVLIASTNNRFALMDFENNKVLSLLSVETIQKDIVIMLKYLKDFDIAIFQTKGGVIGLLRVSLAVTFSGKSQDGNKSKHISFLGSIATDKIGFTQFVVLEPPEGSSKATIVTNSISDYHLAVIYADLFTHQFTCNTHTVVAKNMDVQNVSLCISWSDRVRVHSAPEEALWQRYQLQVHLRS